VEGASLLLLGLPPLSLAMALAWVHQRRTANAGIVDVVWAGALGALAIGYALLAPGWWPRRALEGLLAGLWSARLTWHLWRRVAGQPEDGRYAELRRARGAGFDRFAWWWFQGQGLLVAFLSLAFLVPSAAREPGFGVRDALAVLLWLIAIGGESLADRQLAAWREGPENRGRTCRAGLWRYSRHPNYFFEWLHWLVYPVLALGLPGGWIPWLMPAVLLFLVLRVTGIPPTEAQALRSRGDDYRAYQRTTNAFFPGPPRRARAATGPGRAPATP
jgi:steroid 5-alpha reductase family enzyme